MTTALRTGIRRVAARLAPDDAADGELLARFLATRDEAAFAALVRRHGAMVLSTCRRVLGNAADADDAFQAAFVVLARRAAAFTGRATVGNFLYGVAYHSALKARAMAAKRRLREAKKPAPPAPATDADLLHALDEELARLPEKYRGPVVLCELEGRPRREAAAALGVAEGTISSRLATAHRLLHERLTARGFAVAGLAALLAERTASASPALAVAAVQAAVGGPTGGVTQLVAEVSKMLFLSKLKLTAVVTAGVVVLAVAGAGLRPAPATADEKPRPANRSVHWKWEAEQDEAKKLEGAWVSVKNTLNGDANPPGTTFPTHEWTFKGDDVRAVAMTGKKVGSDVTFRCVLNPHVKPKEMNLVADRSLLLCVYALDGDTLRVATYSRSEVDRPKGFDVKDQPKEADPLYVHEFKRKDAKPKAADLPPTAQGVYSLAEGEALKLIPTPFPPGRNAMLAKLIPQQEPGEPFGWYVLTTTDGKALAMRDGNSGHFPGEHVGQFVVDNSTTLDYLVRTALHLGPQELRGLDQLDRLDADKRYYLDALVREGAPLEKLVPALQQQLKDKYKLDLVLTYAHEERDCVRLTGKHTLADPKNNTIDLYATAKMSRAPITVGGHTQGATVANTLFRFLGLPVFDESDLTTRAVPVRMNLHKRLPPTPATFAEDCDPDKVLKHFAEQTGVTVERVKRKVRMLTVTKPQK